MDQLKGLVPARYIGHPVNLGPGRIYYNIDGTRRTSLCLTNGDCLLMPEAEVLGMTILEDPHHEKDPLHLGIGRRVLPGDEEMTAEELAEKGYVFHLGRPDFEFIDNDVQTKEDTQPLL